MSTWLVGLYSAADTSPLEAMLFALSTDDRTLHIFADEAAAISYCEGVDVQDGGWRFFDGEGEPLEAVFVKPNRRGVFLVESGVYVLRRPSTPKEPLIEALDGVAAVEGPPPLNSVAEVKKLLTQHLRRTP